MNMLNAAELKKRKIIICLFLILGITFLAFSPSINSGFVNWDDDVYVLDNPLIKDFSFQGVAKIFTTIHKGLYKPVVFLSFAVEHYFFKLNPHAYHTTNLVFHLINSLFVFLIILAIAEEPGIAFLAAVLFGVHPLRVESVAWIAERKDMIYSFFYLGALLSYIYYIKQNLRRFYFLALISFVLSLLSKPMGLSFPFIILLLYYFFGIKPGKGIIRKVAPFFLISFVFLALTIYISMNDVPFPSSFNFLTIAFNAVYIIAFYLYKIFFPVKLSCLYPDPVVKAGNLLSAPVCFSIVLIILFIAVAAKSHRHRRKFLFGAGVFFISLLPVLQILPFGPAITADHYTYIPSIGIFFILAEVFWGVYTIKMKNLRIFRGLMAASLVLIISILGVLTWKRCLVWKDSVALWDNVLRNYPNVATAYNSRGAGFLLQKEYDKAHADFLSALKIDPNYYEAYFNLGVFYSAKADEKEAIRLFKKTLLLNPGFIKAYDSLVQLYSKAGNNYEVIKICSQAVKFVPDYAMGYSNQGTAYGNISDYGKAIECFKKALLIEPNLALAHFNLSVAYFYTKQFDLAVKHCDEAVKLGYIAPADFLNSLYSAKESNRRSIILP